MNCLEFLAALTEIVALTRARGVADFKRKILFSKIADRLSLGGVDQSLQNPLKRSDANAV
jgi:hypothetical protein